MTPVRGYSEMKDSGIPWIGMIPEHWKLERGKNILKLLNRPIRENDDVITCFRDGEVTLRKNRREEGFTNSMKEIGYQGIEPGDLVVHGMDGFAGAIGISDSRGKSSPVLNVMDSTQNKKYLMYFLRGMAYKDVFMALSTGIRVRTCDLRWNKLAIFPFLMPSLNEQNSIAAYLDEKCSKIDEIIASEKASIEDYKQWKASIIYEAVTKGLDPNVEMKDSGIEWIGEVPFDWTIIRVKNLLTEINDRSKTGLEEPLSMSQVLGIVPSSMIAVANPATSYVGAKIVKPNDLVFNKLKAHLGVFSVSNYDGLVSPDYAVYRAGERTDPQFLEYLFKTPNCIQEFKKFITGVGAGLSRLYTSDLFNIKVALPAISVQKHIIEYLNDFCSQADALIEEKQSLITDLESYKKSLIYEVVTGKRRVC